MPDSRRPATPLDDPVTLPKGHCYVVVTVVNGEIVTTWASVSELDAEAMFDKLRLSAEQARERGEDFVYHSRLDRIPVIAEGIEPDYGEVDGG